MIYPFVQILLWDFFIIIIGLTVFVTNFFFLTELADARVEGHKKHPEQAGRVHGVLIPRLHLRPIALIAHKPACGQGRNEAKASFGPFQVQQQVSHTFKVFL